MVAIRKDLMVDIETMGSNPNSPVLSIGAVIFDPNGNDTINSIAPNRMFYRVLDFTHQLTKYGRVPDASTIYWWLKQSSEARKALEIGVVPFETGLSDFARFAKPTENVWGYGTDFDAVILNSAFMSANLTFPFGYRSRRCARTIMAEIKTDPIERVGVHHNALDDAIYQVLSVQKAYRKMRGEA